MNAVLPSTAAVQLVILIILIVTPSLYLFLFRFFRLILTRRWKAYAESSELKQSKTARNLCKSLVYFVLFIALLPITVRIVTETRRIGFYGPLPQFYLGYIRIVLAALPPYYIFELINTEGFDPFLWIHHGLIIVFTPLCLSGTILDSKEDILYITYSSALLAQTVLLQFAFFFGHAVGRIWPDSERKYKLFLRLAAYAVIVTVATQTIIWVRFAASVHFLTNFKPIAMTLVMSLVLLVAETHTPWVSYSMGIYVREKLEKDGLEEMTGRSKAATGDLEQV